jgi:beta-glucosidase
MTEIYRDAGVEIGSRVTDLLARMTLEEKLAQLGSLWSREILDHEVFDPAKAADRLSLGIGQITRIAGATNLGARDSALLANRIQRFLIENTRLGIPAIVHEECLHGLLARESVCFPQSLGQAATWDPEMARAMAANLGRELRAMGAQQGLAPIFDITRDPRWGRVEETYGEDPYLVAEMGTAFVRGLQGDGSPAERVFATGKHMVGHGLPEGGLNHATAHIGPRELYDDFLFPFEAAVRAGGLRSIMHAYDDLDGVPCVASRYLLTEVLRDRWGFDGLVVSDYSGIEELITSHAMTADPSVAAALALEAGTDVELPSTVAYGAPLAEAIAAGRLAPGVVDTAVSRVLRAKFELGLFDAPYVDPEAASIPYERDRALARDIARRSIVLLANDGTLPIRPEVRTVAVIGPNADSARNLLGDYSHVVHIESMLEVGGFGDDVPDARLMADDLARIGTILDAIRARARARARVGAGPAAEPSAGTPAEPGTGTPAGPQIRYAAGCGLVDGDDAMIARAVAAATGADVAVLVVGERSGLTDGSLAGEARDRMDIGLPGRQGELVAAVAATGTPVVLVVVAGRPLAIPAEAGLAAAVLHAWVPGEEGPAAIAGVLFGDVNPGGKLPITVPRHVGQVPIYYGHRPSGGRSHWKGDYVDGSAKPLWPFGYGLSYSRFEVSDLTLDQSTIGPAGEVAIRVAVRNCGDRGGDEVVQFYVRDVEASLSRPVKQLRGFKRVHLVPGETRRVTFRLAAEQTAFTGLDGRLIVEPGRLEIMVGTSSEDLPCRAELLIAGEPTVVESRTRYFTETLVE